MLMGVVMFAWHTPALYELALRSAAWHQADMPASSSPRSSSGGRSCSRGPAAPNGRAGRWCPTCWSPICRTRRLSAILVFSDRVLYPSYSAAPRLFRFSALEDQIAAGAIMWVVGSVAFIVPAIVIAVQCLSRKRRCQKQYQWLGDVRYHRSTTLPEKISLASRYVPSRGRGDRIEALSFLVLFLVNDSLLFCRVAHPGLER